jgi:GDP-fucose transporter C1
MNRLHKFADVPFDKWYQQFVKKNGDTVLPVVGSIAFYWITSIALVFLNKYALVGIEGLDAPLFVCWLQLVVAIGGCVVLAKYRKHFPEPLRFPEMEFKLKVAEKVLPLSGIFLGMIVFNNLCLKHVEVSFYHVARALSVLFNVAVSFFMFGVKTSFKCTLAVVVVVLGYALGCEGEVHFSFTGVVYGILSSVFVALYSNFVKKTLPAVDNDAWKLMIYNNINAAAILPIFMLFSGEIGTIISSYKTLFTLGFWVLSSFTGVFGFLINMATFLQIQYTSPLTHNVSGIAKATVQTGIAYVVFGNPVTIAGVVGLFVVLIGSFYYAWQRKIEMDEEKKSKDKDDSKKRKVQNMA